MNTIPFCPIRNGNCHQDCVFNSPDIGCRVLQALEALPILVGEIGQIDDTLEMLLSEPETIVDSRVESM